MSAFDKHDLRGSVGKHLVYTYDNGWNYEIYVKNDTMLDYHIHSGIVGNRWVKDQRTYIARVGESVYKISWTESTGIGISLTANLGDKLPHDIIFSLRWVINNPGKTVCFQNDYTLPMMPCHDVDLVYLIEVIDELATTAFARSYGANNDDVVVCTTGESSKNFPENLC